MPVNPRISRKDYYHYIMIILDLLVPFSSSRNLVWDCISPGSDAAVKVLSEYSAYSVTSVHVCVAS